MPFFPNAQNPSVEHSVLVDVAGDLIIKTPTEEAGINILFRSTTTEMAHNSAKRSLPPQCHPETRKALLSDIQKRIEGSWNSKQRIFWLHGPAGAGKSAVAQTIAGMFDGNQMLAGSFFFAQGKGLRRSAQSFVTTLRYRLCLAYPKQRCEVGRLVLHDQSVLYETLTIQFQKLIVEPFHRRQNSLTRPYWRSRRFIIIIDGLDECDSEHDQLTLLRNIASLVGTHAVPLTFFITSRPAPHIRECFRNDAILSTIYHESPLEPSPDDVRNFLHSEFSRVRQKNPSITEIWPTEDAVNILIEKSSGYFIYPSIILNFIDDVDSRPTAQLDIVLSGTSNSANLELDQLYFNILSTVRKPPHLLVQVLGIILINEQSLIALDVDSILKFPPGETALILRRLHALLNFADEGDISVIHGSFPDFLYNPERSGRFFIDLDEHHATFAQRCLEYMAEYDNGSTNLPSPVWLSEHILPYWDIHITKVSDLHRRRSLLNTLEAISPAQWMSIMKLKLSRPSGPILFDNQLTRVMTWAKSFPMPPPEKIDWLVQIRDMWYRFVVGSIPLLNYWDLEQLIGPYIPMCTGPPKGGNHIWMGTVPGQPERGGPRILPPHHLYLFTDKPEARYYIISHLNPNTSFIEFLCDESRSKGLYSLAVAHAYAIKLYLGQSPSPRNIKWSRNLLYCSLKSDSLTTYLNKYFASEGDKRDIRAIFGWIEKELRITSYVPVPQPVLLFLLRWAEYLWNSYSALEIQELSSPGDYNCTFEMYLARVCVRGFKLYNDHWYNGSQKGHTCCYWPMRLVHPWIAGKVSHPLKPGSLIQHSDQYRSIISFLLAGSQLEKDDLCHDFARTCSDGRKTLKTLEGGAILLQTYPICNGWICSWQNCDRILADTAEMDGHCIEHFYSFWLSQCSA